ncbi:hypothetical protein QEN19_000626 [Hanseniaspora menglaensis]
MNVSSNKRKNLTRNKNIFDFYSLKRQKTLTHRSEKSVSYITLSSDDEDKYNNEITILKEEKLEKTQAVTCKIGQNDINVHDETSFEFKTNILKADLNLKETFFRPNISHTKNIITKNERPIPSYRVHSFPFLSEEFSDKITIDYFPKFPVTKYHFISHLHSDHHVGFSKKWLTSNPETIIVLGKKNYLPFLYKFNLVNYKSEVKPLESDYFNITNRILVVPDDYPLTLYFSVDDQRHIVIKSVDANHCIGAILFVIEYYDSAGLFLEKILHTGDFRFNSNKMLSSLKGQKFSKVYLDTTYISPIWNFTPKDKLLELVSNFMHNKLMPTIMNEWFNKKSLIQKTLDSFFTISIDNKKVKTLIALGSYTIGKEFLAAGLSEKFYNCPVILDKGGFRAVFELPNKNFIKSSDFQTDIIECFKSHDFVIYLGSIRDAGNIKNELKLYKVEKFFNKLLTISISLSGWNYYKWKNFFQELDDVDLLPSFNSNTCLKILKEFNNNEYVKRRFQLEEIYNSDMIFNDEFELNLNDLPKWIIKHDKQNKIVFWKLSYSDHSSYKELSECCVNLDYDQIIPTVNDHKAELIKYHVNLWKMCNSIKKDNQ